MTDQINGFNELVYNDFITYPSERIPLIFLDYSGWTKTYLMRYGEYKNGKFHYNNGRMKFSASPHNVHYWVYAPNDINVTNM